MAGPWEKYQTAGKPSSSAAPWEKYADATPKEDESLFDKGAGLVKDAGVGLLENVVAPVGRFVDRYTGAPTRAGTEELIQGRGIGSALSRYGKQFGEDPELAPTGKKLAQEMGAGETSLSSKLPGLYSDTGNEWTKLKRGGLLDPTASGAAGLGLDMGLDVTNLIPVGAIVKGAGKLAKGGVKLGLEGAELAAKGGAKLADVATGTKLATRAIEGTENLAKRSAAVISKIATPERVENYDKLISTAKKVGVTPEELSAAAEFGKTSTVSRLERHVGEGPLGQKIMDVNEKVNNALAEGTDNVVRKLGSGQVHDAIGAGDVLKSGYANAEKDLLKNSDITYKTAADLTPNMQLTEDAANKLQTTVNGLKKRAAGYMQRGATRDQVAMGKDLAGFAQRLEKNGGNYRQLSDQIGFIGEAMTDPNLNRVHARELRNVYHTLSDSLIDTVKDIHPDLGKQLVENNAKMSSFFKSRDALGRQIQSASANPETVFKSMVGDVGKVDELKKILPTEDFNAFRASYLDSLIKKNAAGHVLYDSSIKAIKKNQGRLSRMFNEGELSEVGDLLELGHAQGLPILSTSGTGASNSFSRFARTMTSGLINERAVKALKSRGRGLINEAPGLIEDAARPAGLTEATLDVGQMGQGALDAIKKRSPRGLLLKGAQSYAPQTYGEQ